MRAATAAAYCDEPNARSFRRKVGTLYPFPVTPGRNAKWLRDDIDAALLRLRPQPTGQKDLPPGFDAASVLL
jgi:hypothetical protein